jgi:hippurate hydrolase
MQQHHNIQQTLILIASHLVVSLQQIISRNNSRLIHLLLSITSSRVANTTNVIPSEVKLNGDIQGNE